MASSPILSSDRIASSLNNRAGYRLIDYGEVGLPVYRMTVLALVLAHKNLSPISEFCLRAIRQGLKSEQEIAGLFGLSEGVVVSALAQLVSERLVRTRVQSATVSHLELTAKGLEVARNEALIQPTEIPYTFIFDGLIRKPKYFGQVTLWTPTDLKAAGVPAVRAMPAARPESKDIDPGDLNEYLDLDRRAGSTEIASFISIEARQKRYLHYMRALLLVYRSETTQDLQVSFAIDGIVSEQHETAFMQKNGIENNPWFRELFANPSKEAPEVKKAKKIFENTISTNVSKRNRSGRAILSLGRKAQKEKKRNGQDNETSNLSESNQAHLEPPIEIGDGPLAVFDHPPLLQKALAESSSRLVIVSPWVRSKIVDREFLAQIRQLLTKGVQVKLGFGLGEDRGQSQQDLQALRSLERLSDKFDNMKLVRFGDTHAKVLIKDSDFAVITSFNWLSFKGDRNRTFREEWGAVITDPGQIDRLYLQFRSRFSD